MQKPKVLLVCANADTAGTPLHVAWLVRALRQRCEFEVVLGEHGPVEEQLKECGCEVTVIPELRSAINPIRDARAALKLRAHISQRRPDLIHVHGSKPGLLGRLIGKQLGIPCLHTVHGWGFGPGRPLLQSIFVVLTEILTSRVFGPSRYIFVSHADARQGSHLGISPNRRAVIWNAVEDHALRADAAASTKIFMAARVAFQKDHATTLRAFERVGFGELVLAGGGTESPEFQDLIASCSPERRSNVRTLGARQDIPELMAQAGIFILTSRYEGLPLSIIEALRAGLPIVATDVGGNRELVDHGANGFLVPPNNPDSVAEVLIALKDGGLRARMGWQSRLKYEACFTTAVAAGKLLDEYDLVRSQAAQERQTDVKTS